MIKTHNLNLFTVIVQFIVKFQCHLFLRFTVQLSSQLLFRFAERKNVRGNAAALLHKCSIQRPTLYSTTVKSNIVIVKSNTVQYWSQIQYSCEVKYSTAVKSNTVQQWCQIQYNSEVKQYNSEVKYSSTVKSTTVSQMLCNIEVKYSAIVTSNRLQQWIKKNYNNEAKYSINSEVKYSKTVKSNAVQ